MQVLLVSRIRGEIINWSINPGDFDSILHMSASARSRTSDSTVYFRPSQIPADNALPTSKSTAFLPISFVFDECQVVFDRIQFS